jgi:hypothetical protein
LIVLIKAGLERKLKDIYLNMNWAERLDITVPKNAIIIDSGISQDGVELANDDFKRESLL